MNKIHIIATISLLYLLVGCELSNVDNGANLFGRRGETPVFTASFEQADTRAYVDSDLYMYWTADDRLSIFTTTYNEQYKFDGQTGDNSGSFSKVTTGQFVSGNAVTTNYGVYPYNSATKLTKDEKIELELPAVQQYASNSFGLGANTMVAVTDGTSDFFLPFKNICGYLVVKLYGDVTVKSLIFEGNNGEKIAGAATVTASHDGVPTVTMYENATTSITIDCGEGVALGKTAETATEFWFVIPPITFEKGFTIKAVGDGIMQMKKVTTISRTIQRNVVNEMPITETLLDTPIDGFVQFEDPNFKAYCVTNFDKDGDGEISYNEALTVYSITVNASELDINSIKGVECFLNLTNLSCYGVTGFKSSVSSLDLSSNTSLVRLYCPNNAIEYLDLSNNTALKELLCWENQITELVLSNNTALTSLKCNYNQISNLDVTGCPNLEQLDCRQNLLMNLDIRNNKELCELYCGGNQLTGLDLSNNSLLIDLWCDYNSLESLDVTCCPIQRLLCNDNKLNSIILNEEVGSIDCSNNYLSSLDVSGCRSLYYFNCSCNQLTSLDLSNNERLGELHCSDNLLAELILSNNPALIKLNCYDNRMSHLDVSSNTALTRLSCYDNYLTSLDVHNNTELQYLLCSKNRLSVLDVSSCLKLYSLKCDDNPYLLTLWLKTGQTITYLTYDTVHTSINYK